jgi:phosphohistidine phosphatase
LKKLLILRHGKAQQDAPNGDHARDLLVRGRRDSEAMGAFIGETIGVPDAIFTSDAQRALHTARLVARAVGFDEEQFTIVPAIYGADLRTLLALVRSILDDVNTAVMVGHNPGFEELTASLAGIDEDDVRLPTAALAHLEFDVDHWDDAQQGTGRLIAITTPKKLAAAAAE